ncbi:alpha-2-macroglobulin [Williamwhitmania taraxaci]|uniref:Alpha-2-macroglobulin n=1 Tax=Williamwhitmania taraxaci TaxID=1640674 RepID=A0A1G6HBH1_9BACT|nr:MG2 domain-containing protein [Williamwhitmania taraxaci]SDB91503.1 hypothetical protein SAMN05216323_100912 [Williamwhitmania taraxaci]
MLKSKKIVLGIALGLAVIASIIGISLCSRSSNEIVQADPRFAAHISAFTSGNISIASTITIRLTDASPAFAGENKPVAEELFDFSPSVEGIAYWIDAQTVEFRPAKLLESGTTYEAKFYLSKVKEVESEFKTFVFGFRTLEQSFEIQEEGLIIDNPRQPDTYTYQGKLISADYLATEKLNEILKATFEGENKTIDWVSEQENRQHTFKITGIKRAESKKELTLKWSGSSINVDNSGDMTVSVPDKNFFGRISDRMVNIPEQAIFIYFSDPLDPRQDLRGLVESNHDESMHLSVQSNVLKVTFSEQFEGEIKITVNAGILNAEGKKLPIGFVVEYNFEAIKPALRAVSSGTILPSSEGLVYPFEAVNLKSIQVTIIKIFENNVPQFLQANRLSGYSDMKRVGRPVFRKTIPLTNSGIADLSRWNRFTLNLDEFIKAEQGAIYQINISFGKSNMIWTCGDIDNSQENLSGFDDEEVNAKEDKAYDGPGYYDYYDEDYEYYEGEDYDWDQRDNPCNRAYFSSNKMITQNILASDIGLIAKRGNSGDMLVAVSDIRTAKSLSGVDIEVLDYQLQPLYKGSTDGDGLASFRVKRVPFLLVAKMDKQRGYLRLDDGSSLSLSNFDISGVDVQKGLKGFIYGERGVWRPGDTLFLGFIVEDKQELLPAGHPIVFELRNPQGQLVSRMVRTYDKTGIYAFAPVTTADAPTGKYVATVKVGGTSFSKQLKIETVKPNRLKVTFELNKDVRFGASGNVQANLNSRWLHGAIAGNLEANYDVTLSKARATFKGFDNFNFDDPGIEAPMEAFPVFDGRLDGNGNASVRTNLKISSTLPSALNANFRGKVFEPGGDFSVDFLTVPILPFDTYVGMRSPQPARGQWVEVDRDQTITLVTVNNSGNPVSVRGLEVEIYKMDWSWWWQDNGNGAASYVNSDYKRPVINTTANTSNGKGSVDFKINYPDWGRYYVRVINPETGQSCGEIIYMDWPMSRGRSKGDMPGGATMLSLSTDKSSVKVGDDVKVTIPGAEKARALISIENGSRIIKAFWVDADKNDNTIEIEATEEMTPNVFIHVTLVQPHLRKNNDMPIRQYGIVPLEVIDPKTKLTPQIQMAESLKPEQEVAITVSEKDGKPMTYTIAVVDEGLLDITRFKTPDAWSNFYAKEALGVKSFDLYDDIIGAFGGEMARLLSLGGDEALKAEEDGNAIRFKPVVKFMGPFTLKGGKATHKFRMPNYVGSVRTMIVAANKGAYGFAEKATPVKQALMVMATLPRVLGPAEEVLLPVNVFAMEKSVKQVSIKVKTSSLLQIVGNNSQNITFDKPGDKVVFFRLKARPSVGNAKVEVYANGAGNKSTYTIDMQIRNANVPMAKVTDMELAPGKSWNNTFQPFGIAGTNKVSVELSAIPPINLGERLDYLISYPHGCVEQTTSGAFPQLYLAKLISLPKDKAERTEVNVKYGIDRLMQFQTVDGGFMYWPGSYRTADDWSTSYVGHFLLEAKKMGYSVPDQMLSKWKEYQTTTARRWTSDATYRYTELAQSYRLYTLALAGSPELGAMNKLKEIKDLSIQSQWRLAAAYALAGKRDVATQMIASLPDRIPVYREWSYTYGSDFRDRAMILETLTELDKTAQAASVAKELAVEMNSNRWMSTQETAYSLMAIAKYQGNAKGEKGLKASITINGKQESIDSDLSMVDQSIAIKESSNALLVNNRSKGMLFVKLREVGVPLPGEEAATRSNINMTVRFLRDGNSIDVSRLKQGTEFMVEVTLTHPGVMREYKELALTEVFPSGWEIRNTRMEGNEPSLGSAASDYQDYRDDRVMTYFGLRPGETKRYVLMVTATYAGKFYFPGAYCEAMYDNTISAKEKGMWVEVVTE